MLRADEAPGGARPEQREEMLEAERDALRSEFLSSPEGREFAPDGNEAFAVSLAIDLCADYVDGRPLRWSPVLVELFMVSWVPRGRHHRRAGADDLYGRLERPEHGLLTRVRTVRRPARRSRSSWPAGWDRWSCAAR